VRQILDGCYKEAKALLADNMVALDRIAEKLIAQETITGKEFMQLFREIRGETAALPENPDTGTVTPESGQASEAAAEDSKPEAAEEEKQETAAAEQTDAGEGTDPEEKHSGDAPVQAATPENSTEAENGNSPRGLFTGAPLDDLR